MGSSLSGFSAVTHGFPFPNSWEPGTPVVEISTPFGSIKLGDASGGVCGGMVFAAADFFLLGISTRRDRSPELVRYFCKRLLDSWSLPFGVLRYYDWQRRPGHSRSRLGVVWSNGVTKLTIEEELPKIRSTIDAGMPALLGVVKVQSWHPREMARNHQVLCYGYAETDSITTLHCYDPNWPDTDVALRFDHSTPNEERLIDHSVEGETVRGLFLATYERPEWEELGNLGR